MIVINGVQQFFLIWVIAVFTWFAPLNASVADEADIQDLLVIQKKFTGDYNQMIERRLIRALVPYSKTFFFLDGPTPRGLSYDGLKAFEKYINEQVQNKNLKVNIVIIPTTRDQLLTHLQEGKGDIVVGNLTITDSRKKRVDFSDPVLENVDEILVTGPKSPKITKLSDLAGQKMHVRKSSSYYESLKQLNDKLAQAGKKPVWIVPADENLEDEDLLEMVNAGLISMITMDNHKAKFWSAVFKDIAIHPEIKVRSGGQIAWAMRRNTPQFKKEINQFIKKNKKGTAAGNIRFKKYLKDTKYISNLSNSEEMRRFKEAMPLFKKYANQYNFDWLMLAALAYQESGIDQSKRSLAGAVGVMQLLPSTAKDKNVNIPDINSIGPNIHAGAKYLRFMADRYFNDPKIDNLNKWLFAFASYNVCH